MRPIFSCVASLVSLVALAQVGEGQETRPAPVPPAVVPADADGTWIVLQAGEVVQVPEVVSLLKAAPSGEYSIILYPKTGRPSTFSVVVSTDGRPLPPPQPKPTPAPSPGELTASGRAAFALAQRHAKNESDRFAAAAALPPATATELAAKLLAADRAARTAYGSDLAKLLEPIGEGAVTPQGVQLLRDVAAGFAEAAK